METRNPKNLMKTITRTAALFLIALLGTAATSCTTTYDAAGRPVQSVDPGTAAAGALAAGALGYAIGQNNDDHHYHHYGYRRPYYGRYGYRKYPYYGRRGFWHR